MSVNRDSFASCPIKLLIIFSPLIALASSTNNTPDHLWGPVKVALRADTHVRKEPR